MIDHKSRSLPTNRYRRCKSSDDLLAYNGYSNDRALEKSATIQALKMGHEMEGPRLLRRAERYRMAGRLSDSYKTDVSKSMSSDLFFDPVKDPYNVLHQKKSPKGINSITDDEVRKSSVVFVYSGPEKETRQSFKQWSERSQGNKISPRDKNVSKTSPRSFKKTSIRVKEKVTSFLQHTPVLRRRKKGIDYTTSLDSRTSSTMQHTKSLPNVLDDDLRPRSKSIDVWNTGDPDSLWSLAGNEKSGRTGTESSGTSSSRSDSVTLGGKVGRSMSLAKSRKEVEKVEHLSEKACSYNDILSPSNRSRSPLADRFLDGSETDDDLSSVGSETSPYLSHRNSSGASRVGTNDTKIIIRQAPELHVVNSYNDEAAKQIVDTKRLLPAMKFQNIRIREIVDEELRIYLEGKPFDPSQLTSWSQLISTEVKQRVEEATFGQYKIVVQVFIASLVENGFSAASQCMFRQECDSFVIASYRGLELFALASVLAIDFRCDAEVDISKEYNSIM